MLIDSLNRSIQNTLILFLNSELEVSRSPIISLYISSEFWKQTMNSWRLHFHKIFGNKQFDGNAA
jgi:hypothetical protein